MPHHRAAWLPRPVPDGAVAVAPRVVHLTLAVLLMALLPSPAQAATTEPALNRLSLDPVPGDYTLLVRVDNFELLPGNATGAGDPEAGWLHYLLNGHPCAGECARGQAFKTNATRFTYHRLVVADNVTVELRYANGTQVQATRIVEDNVTQVPVRHTAIVAQTARGPLVAVASGVPNPGDYTMSLRVERFELLPPGSDTPEAGAAAGHVRYTLNGAPCTDACSDGQPAETEHTEFTFHGVQAGDRLGAELVRPDGSSLVPRASVVLLVAQPAIRIVSGIAQEADYTMRVNVTGFTLQSPGGTPNAGVGHIEYLVQSAGTSNFQPASCRSPAQTASVTFQFCGLREGDRITARLVTTAGEPLDPDVRAPPLEVLALPEEEFVPSVGPLVGVLLLGLAALRRRTA